MRAGKERAASSSEEIVLGRDDESVVLVWRLEQEAQEERHAAQLARVEQELQYAEMKRLEEQLWKLGDAPQPSISTLKKVLSEVIREPTVADLCDAAATALSPEEQAAHDSVHTAMASLKDAADIEALHSLLCHPGAKLTVHRAAVSACIAAVTHQHAEVVLGGWAVHSFNEWGRRDRRVLILSSHAVYRVESIRAENEAPKPSSCIISSRTPLDDVSHCSSLAGGCLGLTSRGRRDGRANPLSPKTGKRAGLLPQHSNPHQRVYAPLPPSGAVEAAKLQASMRDLIVEAVEAARRLQAGTEMQETVAVPCATPTGSVPSSV